MFYYDEMSEDEIKEYLRRVDALQLPTDPKEADVALETFKKNYFAEIERNHFLKIATSPEAVLEDIREKGPKVLEMQVKDYREGFPEEIFNQLKEKNPELFEGIIFHEGEIYFTTSAALDFLQSFFHLHMDYLTQEEAGDAWDQIGGILSEIVTKSAFVFYEKTEDGGFPDWKTTGERSFFSRWKKRGPLPDFDKYNVMNDKSIYAMISTDGKKGGNIPGQLSLFWSVEMSAKDRKDIPVFVGLEYDEEILGKLSNPFTYDDNRLQDAVATLYNAWTYNDRPGKLIFSDEEIALIFRGQNVNGRKDGVTKKQLEKVRRLINREKQISFWADITEEVKAGMIKDKDFLPTVEGESGKTYIAKADEIKKVEAGIPLLELKVVRITKKNGKEVYLYELQEAPILYRYNLLKNRVLYPKKEFFEIPQSLAQYEYIERINHYLTHQIKLMEDGRRDNNLILLSTFYRDTRTPVPAERIDPDAYAGGAASPNFKNKVRQKEMKDRESFEGFLDVWKDKKLIKAWKQHKDKNGKIDGYLITVFKRSEQKEDGNN